jgi:N-acetyl-beta-hexosaminidase
MTCCSLSSSGVLSTPPIPTPELYTRTNTHTHTHTHTHAHMHTNTHTHTHTQHTHTHTHTHTHKANMWGEHVDAANFMPRVWPRASVIAERLWSAANVTDVAEAEARLHEFRCKLLTRGIAASPIGAFDYDLDGPYHKA